MVIAGLVDPAICFPRRLAHPRPVLRHVHPIETQVIAECFISTRTRTDPLVALAYQQLEMQTDQQFAALTDPQGPYRITVVGTGDVTPYSDAGELVAAVLASRTLEVTASRADRLHPLLGGEAGSAYYRFRAVHDLIGHVATGYGFDQDGEYSAWLVQRNLYTGLARWAAATELHGEVSVLWTTHQFGEHKAVLLDSHLVQATIRDSGDADLTAAQRTALPCRTTAGDPAARQRCFAKAPIPALSGIPPSSQQPQCSHAFRWAAESRGVAISCAVAILGPATALMIAAVL